MDWIDKLLGIGSTPDWISPLSGIFGDFTNGSYRRFYISRYAGYSCDQITKMLKDKGVKVWGDTIIDDMIVFTVKETQGGWARYLLQQASITIEGESNR